MSLRGWQPSEIQAGPGGRPSPERHWLRTGSPGQAGGTAPHVVTGRREQVTGRRWRCGGHRALEGVGAGGHAPVSHPVPSNQRGLCGFSLKEVTAHYTVPRDRKILSFTLLPEQAAQTLVSPYCGRRGDARSEWEGKSQRPPWASPPFLPLHCPESPLGSDGPCLPQCRPHLQADTLGAVIPAVSSQAAHGPEMLDLRLLRRHDVLSMSTQSPGGHQVGGLQQRQRRPCPVPAPQAPKLLPDAPCVFECDSGEGPRGRSSEELHREPQTPRSPLPGGSGCEAVSFVGSVCIAFVLVWGISSLYPSVWKFPGQALNPGRKAIARAPA